MRTQGIEKRPQPLRRSARLQKGRQNDKPKHRLSSSPITNPPNPKAQHHSPPPHLEATSPPCPPHESDANQETERKRKRSQEREASQENPSRKRLRADTNGNQNSHRVETWLQKQRYPEDYFESGNKTWEDIKADIGLKAGEMNDLAHPLLAKKKSATSLRWQALEANTGTPTQETEDKSAGYQDSSYEQFLKEHGSYLREFHQGIEEDSKNECQNLLNTEQAVPKDSDTLFRDDVFQATCEKLRGRNEARVISDIARLIVPSAETLATYGATHLEHLVVGLGERWNESIPLTPTARCPQPDLSVGFTRDAFTPDQLKRLEPFTGNIFASTKLASLLLATWRMYFPFFTCEVKCGLGGLDIADRQNANSMTLSMKGLVELFRFVKRENEVHRKILAFSISHDDKVVRIFGHYPVIDGDKTTFYRHPIKNFDFTSEEGKEKWIAYKFTKNIYDTFVPKHHKLICSGIDDIPVNLNFGVSSASFGSNPSVDTEMEPDSQEMAASASASQDTAGSKRKRLTGNRVLLQLLEDQKRESKEELERQKLESERQRLESERQRQESEERWQDKLEDQRRQFNAVITQMQTLNANSGNDSEVVIMLRQELERQRQENQELIEEISKLTQSVLSFANRS